MKNTLKKKSSSNKTKKNNVKKCMETFVEKKLKLLTKFIDEDIKKIENKLHDKIKGIENKNMIAEQKQMLAKLKKRRKETINTSKKLYKLNNCNTNCKNTLLEPGSPDELPKSIHKQFSDSKEMLKFLTEHRKSIFSNKTNVLVDSFYEKTPNKLKTQLIKDGAISHCVPNTKIVI